jgi:hypothetical protein
MTRSPSLLRSRAPTQRAHGKTPSLDIIILCFLIAEVCFFSWRNVVQPCIDATAKAPVPFCQHLAPSPGKPLLDVPYKIFRARSIPCESPAEKKWEELQNEPLERGLLFMNLVHSEDTIFESVALQIADPKSCAVRMGTTSKMAHQMGYGNRNNETSHLFTVVRSPTERAIRDFFHHMVTLRKYEPSDVEFQAYLEERGYQNRNLQELALQEYLPGGDEAVVNSILQGYDFIGVAERRDETLVVMKLLYGLKTSQILYLQNLTPFAFNDNLCSIIVKPFVSPGMKDFFLQPEWQDRITGDSLLYQAANTSLDKTIDRLGRSIVEKELKALQVALKHAKDVCQERTTFSCNHNGMWQRQIRGCQYNGYGCGSPCLSTREVTDLVDK